MSRAEWQRKILVAGASVLAWLAASQFLGRSLAAWAYRLDGVSEVERLRRRVSLPDFQLEVLHLLHWIGISAALFVAFRWWLASRQPERVLAQLPAASRVGLVRLWVCLVCATLVAWEDVASTALLPAEMLRSMGLMDLLRLLPGAQSFAASPAALATLKWGTVGALLLAGFGWRQRWTLPLATLGYFVVQGWLRQYFRFYHVGIVPGYLLLVLCAWLYAGSPMMRRGENDPKRPQEPAWAIWTCWLVLALTYFEAGLMKLRRGGPLWWEPDNLRQIVLQDNLNPMEFDFDLWKVLWDGPDWQFALLGLATLAVELAFPLVLVSRRARYILPLAAALMHLGIWFLQNVFFPDLILVQAIFLVGLWGPPPRGRASAVGAEPSPSLQSGSDPGRRRALWVAGVMLFAFAFRLELYPLTAMQMYSGRDQSGVVEWLEMNAQTEGGEVVDFDPAELIPATRDSRFRWPFYFVFERPRGSAEALLRSLASRYEAMHDVALAEVRLRRCQWHFLTDDAEKARADFMVTWKAAQPRTSTLEVDGQPCTVR